MHPSLPTKWVKCFVISLSLFVSYRTTAQFTPSHTFTIEASTNSVQVQGSGEQGNHIFPNGRIGIRMNNGNYRVYKTDGTLLTTFSTNLSGFTTAKIIGLSNNQLLLLADSRFAIMNLAGQTILPVTSTGMSIYAGGYPYLDAAELSNGDIAFSTYASDGSNQIRVFTKAGVAVSSIVNVKTTGTGRPSPSGNQYYSGQIKASNNGTFLFVYTTYYAGIHGVMFNNDGTMRTWPATGNNHYQLLTTNGQDGFELFATSNGDYMVSLMRSNIGGVRIGYDGAILSTSIARGTNSYNIGALAVNRKTGGNYARATADESIGTRYDGTDDFNGTANLYAEQRSFTGTVNLAKQSFATGYYNVQYDDNEWDYLPNIRPGIFTVSSIEGGSGGYGFITMNYNTAGNAWSLTMRLYDVTGTLPVKLESFQGKKQNESAVLNWNTSGETAFSHFEVEWSADGSTFAKAGTVQSAAGNGAKAYTFTHPFTADMSQESRLYYRLKMVDKDNSYTYSSIVTINNSNFSDVKLYPVPAADHIWIEVPVSVSRQQPVYSIVTPGGQIVLQGKITQAVQQIQLPAMAPGMYYLRLNNETGKSFLKK
jgi:hypothetical protein